MAEEFRTPQSANEALLQNWAGADNELRAPQSRIEKLLLAILGEDVTPDPPQSVNEELLTQIYEQGGGGNSPFELYKTSARYKQGDTMTEDEKAELDIANGNVVIAYAESEGIVLNAVRVRAYAGGYFFNSYKTTSTSGTIIVFTFQQDTPLAIYSLTVQRDGVQLPSPTIWFEYYKLK